MLSRIGFHSSKCTREVPHFPGAMLRSTSPSASSLPTTCSWLTTHFPASSETDLLFQCHHGGPGAKPQRGTSSLHSPSCLLLDQLWTRFILSFSRALIPLGRTSPLIALSSFPEGPRSASVSVLWCFSSVTRHYPSFFLTSLSSLLCLSFSPCPRLFLIFNVSSPFYSFVFCFSSSYSPHNYFPGVVKLTL